MFKSKINSKLLLNAWNDFERRIKYRIFFAFAGKDTDEVYDPDFEVESDAKRKPPSLPAYINYGLRHGRNFVMQTISRVPDDTVSEPKDRLAPNPKAISLFLYSNQYIVTMTDKNLGIAVSRRDWIIEKSLDLLSDKANYVEIHELVANQIFEHQCIKMSEIAKLASETHPTHSRQLGKFLQSQVTEKDERGFYKKHAVPMFYGIPKIHKTPVKMRPIIPCHSAIQNPAAKYISKCLKPIIQWAPTIIHGSKDLAIKLSKLRMVPGQRYFIVTGDVVAFYPNIPLDDCLEIVEAFYTKSLLGSDRHNVLDFDEEEMALLKLFKRCLRIGNVNLVTQFQGKFYKQRKGLAMGVACSPDLANLYGLYFELICGIQSQPDIVFYGRYIDDCLAIVKATSEADALTKVGTVQFDGCVIEWSASRSHQPFLDMLLYNDIYGDLQYMPYRKARNHMERIPWASHHPLDVKRGTFIGEMSRMATLSSTHTAYKEALLFLGELYVQRGYPKELCEFWLRKYAQERWEQRLRESRPARAEEVLVLKSEFNLAWNYFSAKELGNTIIGVWRNYINLAEQGHMGSVHAPVLSSNWGDLGRVDPDLCTRIATTDGVQVMPDVTKLGFERSRWLVSRKRTRNLFDFTTTWKQVVLRGMDRAASERVVTQLRAALPPILEESTQSLATMDVDSDSGDSVNSVPSAWREGALGNFGRW